jgi:nascent polypeptide-associated complex subunit alpha
LMSFRPRDLKRAMKRMGIDVEELNVVRVNLELGDGSRLLVEEPQAVLLVKAKGQPPMVYIIGDIVKVEAGESAGKMEVSEEDIALVAEQAGVSREEARRALEEVGGDIAAAILRLRGES